ncbi:MAG: hypothetical protein ORN50_04985 [Crocinitomicaceae bacterium]|nr:hypothetical protein [Crocinitomicaceae bacterium]
MTDKQIERLVHHYGAVLEVLEEEAVVIQQTCDQERHYAMMDGSMVFVREEGWKELKLGRVFAESACYHEKKRGVISQSRYVAHLGNHQNFLTKFDHEVQNKKQIVATKTLNVAGITVDENSKLIYANPEEMNQIRLPSVAIQLASIVDIDADTLQRMLRSRPLRYIPIMRKIDPVVSTKIVAALKASAEKASNEKNKILY